MCGIAGFISKKYLNNSKSVLLEMISELNHRGPDDSGSKIWNDENFTVGFGHTRLSILDLSNNGSQPFFYNNLAIVYNGEIYNFAEIKNELIELGHKFNTNCDTEIVIHAYDQWNLKCVNKFIGMFVFSIYDISKNKIFFFRDRVGVKPLYYYYENDQFLFSSEIKAFHKHPKFLKKIDMDSVGLYMNLGYIPSPKSIFSNCYKLDPGSCLEFCLESFNISISKYWNVLDFYKKPKLNISYNDALQKTEDLLTSSYNYRLVSDVPVGVFLSGGYDSTSVVALLSKNNKLKTFTIGFKEGNNEAPYAKSISEHFGTSHTEYFCTEKEAKSIISELPQIYDEPFADTSAIPTVLVSRLAKQDVTVSLSADGGDEIFAGYTIYNTYLENLTFVKSLNNYFGKSSLFFLNVIKYLIPEKKYYLKHKIITLIKIFSTNLSNYHNILFKSYFFKNEKLIDKLLLKSYDKVTTIFDSLNTNLKEDLEVPQAIDFSIYLSNNILTKVDRATMSVGLEGREPLLDHRIIEFVAQLPSEYKFKKHQKLILKDIVHKYIPKELMDRPKTGFTLPIYDWLKTDLKFLIDDHLSEDQILQSETFNYEEIKLLKKNFLNNKLSDDSVIWKVLQFQMWYKKWM